jgi:hypothetical protein
VGGTLGHGFTACPDLFQKSAAHRFVPVLDKFAAALIPTESPVCGCGLISAEEKISHGLSFWIIISESFFTKIRMDAHEMNICFIFKRW